MCVCVNICVYVCVHILWKSQLWKAWICLVRHILSNQLEGWHQECLIKESCSLDEARTTYTVFHVLARLHVCELFTELLDWAESRAKQVILRSLTNYSLYVQGTQHGRSAGSKVRRPLLCTSRTYNTRTRAHTQTHAQTHAQTHTHTHTHTHISPVHVLIYILQHLDKPVLYFLHTPPCSICTATKTGDTCVRAHHLA